MAIKATEECDTIAFMDLSQHTKQGQPTKVLHEQGVFITAHVMRFLESHLDEQTKTMVLQLCTLE